jgi:hypothetical protein
LNDVLKAGRDVCKEIIELVLFVLGILDLLKVLPHLDSDIISEIHAFHCDVGRIDDLLLARRALPKLNHKTAQFSEQIDFEYKPEDIHQRDPRQLIDVCGAKLVASDNAHHVV